MEENPRGLPRRAPQVRIAREKICEGYRGGRRQDCKEESKTSWKKILGSASPDSAGEICEGYRGGRRQDCKEESKTSWKKILEGYRGGLRKSG